MSIVAGVGRVPLQATLQRLYDDLPVDVVSLQDGFLVARGTTAASVSLETPVLDLTRVNGAMAVVVS